MLRGLNWSIDRVVNFEIDDETVVERISGRWIHKASGRSYHTKFAPPKKAGFDDQTGEPLMQRADDNVHTIRNRLKTFHEQTTPVLRHYAGTGRVSNINAVGSIGRVWSDVKAALETGR